MSLFQTVSSTANIEWEIGVRIHPRRLVDGSLGGWTTDRVVSATQRSACSDGSANLLPTRRSVSASGPAESDVPSGSELVTGLSMVAVSLCPSTSLVTSERRGVLQAVSMPSGWSSSDGVGRSIDLSRSIIVCSFVPHPGVIGRETERFGTSSLRWRNVLRAGALPGSTATLVSVWESRPTRSSGSMVD